MGEAKIKAQPLPAHIEATIHSLARLHAEHHQNATPLQRAAERLTSFVVRPTAFGGLTAFIAAWIGLNLLASALGYQPLDPPPFHGLECGASLFSLYLVVLILTTQQRENRLVELREQLNLELAALSEQKTAKVIRLLEEARRDNPLIRDRIDDEAEAMAAPADATSVAEAIKDTHAAAEQAGHDAHQQNVEIDAGSQPNARPPRSRTQRERRL